MVNRIPAWIFLAIALLLIALALAPVMRVAVGVDQSFGLQFLTVVMLLIGGLMSGLTAMILLVRRQPKIDWSGAPAIQVSPPSNRSRLCMHACGLLIFTGIPLLNFLVCYWLWLKHRYRNKVLDTEAQEVLNFQITMYLYLLLSLFMVIAGIGIISTPLLLAFHLLMTLFAMLSVLCGKRFKYPANIPIIQGR